MAEWYIYYARTSFFRQMDKVMRYRKAFGGPDNPPKGSTVMGIFQKWDEIEDEMVEDFEDDPRSIDDFAGHSKACTKCGWKRALNKQQLSASKKFQRDGTSTWTCESALLEQLGKHEVLKPLDKRVRGDRFLCNVTHVGTETVAVCHGQQRKRRLSGEVLEHMHLIPPPTPPELAPPNVFVPMALIQN